MELDGLPPHVRTFIGSLNLVVGGWMLAQALRGKACPKWYMFVAGGSAVIAGGMHLYKAQKELAQAPALQPAPTGTSMAASWWQQQQAPVTAGVTAGVTP